MGSNLEITNEIENYINNNSLKLNSIQKEIISYNQKLGDIKKMQISISQCHFLHLIIKISPESIDLKKSGISRSIAQSPPPITFPALTLAIN